MRQVRSFIYYRYPHRPAAAGRGCAEASAKVLARSATAALFAGRSQGRALSEDVVHLPGYSRTGPALLAGGRAPIHFSGGLKKREMQRLFSFRWTQVTPYIEL